jgi:hypothetical protein
MADKKIKIEVDLDAEPSIAKLKQLKKALKEVTAGSDDWNLIKNSINDTEDALKSAGQGADNFAEIIGTLPGPLGELGNKLGSTVNTLKIFGGIKLDALKNSFTELGKDVIDSAKGIGKLTGLTKLYSIANNALSKSFFGVAAGETAAAVAAGVLTAALAATGITLLIGAVALLVEAYKDWAGGAEKAAAAQKELNERTQKGIEAATAATTAFNKSQEELNVKRAQVEGKTEADIQKIREDAARGRIKIQQDALAKLQAIQGADTNAAADAVAIAQDDLTKIQLDGQIARNAKTNAANKIQQGIDKQNLESIKKNAIEATNSLLTEREQQRQKITDDYAAKIKLAKQYGESTYVLEEAQKKAQKDLQDKFDKEDDEKEIAAKLQKYENLITDIDYQNELLDNDYQADLQRLANKEAYLAEQKALELSNTELTLKERNEIIGKYAEKERKVEKDTTAVKKAETQARIELNLAYANALGGFGRLLGQIAGQNKGLAKTAIIIEQAAGIASIAINAKKNFIADGGIKSPLAWANLVLAGTSAIAAALAAKKGIEEIDKVNVPGGGGGGGSSVSAPLPEYSSGMAMNTPQINTTGGANPATQISQTIQNAQSVPIKAYVVSGEIASQQQLDRKANRGATFNLG